MKSRVWALATTLVLAYGCASTAPAPTQQSPATMQGIASWYGEEFAGRTTANGEIFDPMLMTAAHRTLPFGTVLDITNPATSQTVRVRVNDRGPYIGNRVIDLSYAAAQKIGLIEPGVGNVVISVVKVGKGEREAPAPLEVTIPTPASVASASGRVTSAGDPPAVAFPLPTSEGGVAEPRPASTDEGVVDRVDVEVQRGDVITRKQVTPDGKSFEEVPVGRGEAPTASAYDEQRLNSRRREAAAPPRVRQFFVQVGAFSVEANAKALQERLAAIGHRATVDHSDDLYRVRLGPFSTRDAAVATRTALEDRGVSALIVSE